MDSPMSLATAPGAAGRFCSHHSAARRVCTAARAEILTRNAMRVLLRKIRQQLLERYELAALNLGHCSKKFFLLRGRQAEWLVSTARDHCNESTFPKRDALDDDLAVDDGASCDLHGRDGTPQGQRLCAWRAR